MIKYSLFHHNIFSVLLVCGISLCVAMDEQRPILRMGVITFDIKKEKKLDTYEALRLVLRIPPLHDVENIFNNKKDRRCTVDCLFQMAWYDKRQAALAAHLILKGAPLKNNKGEGLADYRDQLKAHQLNKMSAVIDAGYIWRHMMPLLEAFKKGELSKKEQEQNEQELLIGSAAYEALEFAYAGGKDLIDVMEYQSATKADCIYVLNSDQTVTIKNFFGVDCVLKILTKK